LRKYLISVIGTQRIADRAPSMIASDHLFMGRMTHRIIVVVMPP